MLSEYFCERVGQECKLLHQGLDIFLLSGAEHSSACVADKDIWKTNDQGRCQSTQWTCTSLSASKNGSLSLTQFLKISLL